MKRTNLSSKDQDSISTAGPGSKMKAAEEGDLPHPLHVLYLQTLPRPAFTLRQLEAGGSAIIRC